MSEFEMNVGTMDWYKAAVHLANVQTKCIEGGSRGIQYLSEDVRPLKQRLESGERSEKLYAAIMRLNYE